jgi:hypothetical protein
VRRVKHSGFKLRRQIYHCNTNYSLACGHITMIICMFLFLFVFVAAKRFVVVVGGFTISTSRVRLGPYKKIKDKTILSELRGSTPLIDKRTRQSLRIRAKVITYGCSKRFIYKCKKRSLNYI